MQAEGQGKAAARVPGIAGSPGGNAQTAKATHRPIIMAADQEILDLQIGLKAMTRVVKRATRKYRTADLLVQDDMAPMMRDLVKQVGHMKSRAQTLLEGQDLKQLR